MDRIETYRIFTLVAAHGSFSEASRKLRISASAVTRAIAELENHLGVVLIHRTTRSVRLTERGQIFLESCQQILFDTEAAEAQVRGADASPRGQFNITAPILFGRLHVLPIVNGLIKQHGDLNIRLTLSDRYVHLAEDGVDLAIRIGTLPDSSLVARKLGQVARVLVASSAYVQERGAPTAPEDLADHDIIAFESVDATNEWRMEAGHKPVRVNPRLIVNSADAAIVAAQDGIGITRALSYQVRDAIAAGRLVQVLRDHASDPMPVNAVFPSRRLASPNLNAFLDAARAHFKDNTLDQASAPAS